MLHLKADFAGVVLKLGVGAVFFCFCFFFAEAMRKYENMEKLAASP